MLFGLIKKTRNTHHEEPVTRAASFGLVLVLVLVSLPLAPLLPLGIWGIVTVAVIWRLRILRTKGGNPGWLVRTLLVVAAFAFILLHYRTVLGLEAGAATLVSAYTLKLLEMRSRRDALLLCFLGFFVAVTGLLFSQSIPMTLYLLICLMMLVSVLIGLHQATDQTTITPVLKTGVVLTLQALPVMLILFVLVPRLPPLWAVPLPDASAKTGLSDEMSPGDIARLSQSDELAFRATFTGAVPPPEERYWRAVVMHWFDGRRWYMGTPEDWGKAGVKESQLVSRYGQERQWAAPDASPEEYNYDIILEATGRQWKPVLGSVSSAVTDSVLTRDWRLIAQQSIELRTRYAVESGAPKAFDTELPSWLRAADLQLPRGGDPRARKLARELNKKHGGNAPAIVADMLSRFRNQPYFYTLRPPTLKGNTIDAFLFDSRRGFCAHYAGAMTFVLRAAGIPSRVVAGYQGGEQKDQVIQVRQFDAHAWVEYWIPEKGWQRVDPTAAVSPARIERGLESAVQNEGSFLEGQLLSAVKYRHISWLNTLRLEYEQLEYDWQRLVLSYDDESQKDLFGSLFPGEDALTVLTRLLVITMVSVILLALLWLVKPWQRQGTPADRYYQGFCRSMARKGIARRPEEGPLDYARRIAKEKPELGRRAMQVAGVYIRLTYGVAKDGDLGRLKRLC